MKARGLAQKILVLMSLDPHVTRAVDLREHRCCTVFVPLWQNGSRVRGRHLVLSFPKTRVWFWWVHHLSEPSVPSSVNSHSRESGAFSHSLNIETRAQGTPGNYVQEDSTLGKHFGVSALDEDHDCLGWMSGDHGT